MVAEAAAANDHAGCPNFAPVHGELTVVCRFKSRLAASLALSVVLSSFFQSATAAQLVRFAPEGAMARIVHAEADFDSPVTALGNGQAPAPYRITCDGKSTKGSGRWVDTQHWIYTFEQPLAGAVSCNAEPNPDFRDLTGQPVAGLRAVAFTTGGPRATLARPYDDHIAEDQVFVVSFNTLTDSQSVIDHTHCEIQGLGEAVPVRLITGTARGQILKSMGWNDEPEKATRAQLLQCKRLLPSDAMVRLVVGPGVQTFAHEGQPPVVGQSALSQNFRVRTAFHATMNCTRTNAHAPCSPLFPITLNFSSPVPYALAGQIVLRTPNGTRHAEELAKKNRGDNAISFFTFQPPFAEKSAVTLEVPRDLHDDMGRPLSNAVHFPLSIPIDAMPPLVKFAAGPFGILERFADAPPDVAQTPAVPLALRRVGPQLRTHELMISAGQVSDHVTTDDAQALRWFARVQRLQDGQLTEGQFADIMASHPMRDAKKGDAWMDVRSRSIFTPRDPARELKLPGLDAVHGPDIEMIGVPVPQPGLHVLEIASPRLGATLLAHKDNAGQTMYVRSAVLITNLAVHVKTGRDDILVWVTSLDSGKPVPGAHIAVLSCDGKRLLSGTTNGHGIWHELQSVPAQQSCDDTGQTGVFVTARIPASNPAAHGKADFSFAWSSWDQGIEPWRFNLPFSRSGTPDWVAHAVMDRALLRTGETVSMKLFLRTLTRNGVSNLPCVQAGNLDCLPKTVQIVHAGSGDTVPIPITWQREPTGGVYALLSWYIAPNAHLGRYEVQLAQPKGDAEEGDWIPTLSAGSFQVESFKLPVLTGSLKITQTSAAPAGGSATRPEPPPPAGTLIDPAVVRADLQLAWQSGGPARDLSATISAMSQPLTPGFANYDNYTFGMPDDMSDTRDQPSTADLRRLILDKRPVKLDEHGGAQVGLTSFPAVHQPQTWRFETSFADPNGEIQTLSQTAQVWPAAVVVGLRAGSWMPRGQSTTVRLIALDTAGYPKADVPVQLDGRVRTTWSTRQRLVGGFYAYDSHSQVSSLGTLCHGKTNVRGEFDCPVKLDRDGEVQLIAGARDAAGHVSQAGTTIWVWGSETWFGGRDDNRIDVTPNRMTYKPGETAEFTVRMPFRHADALVAVEREGVLETHVVTLDGSRPVVRIPVEADWGPNVYVSVLAVRSRIRSVPWSSFLDWGWKHPIAWVQARSDQVADAPAPTGLVDLAKPTFRFGITQIHVASDADRLTVEVHPDRATYHVRDKVRVEIQAFLPDGKPAAHAGVAFAAVDEALLDLKNNTSWDLLDAMRVMRNYGVDTATAQGEVVGQRHYGRKAVPAGGGGGFAPTRSLFNTLLLWRGDLVLDDQGKATVEVPLNDSLTRFRLVAVVDDGADKFGTGSADIVSTQDLQLVSGVPLVAREGDQYQASVTVRNRTSHAMPITVAAQIAGTTGNTQNLPAQQLELAAGSARTVSWPTTAPTLSGSRDEEQLTWTFDAVTREDPKASDRIIVHQTLHATVPVAVQQAMLVQMLPGATQQVAVNASATALSAASGLPRGGIQVTLQSSLAGTLPGVHAWLAAYPYTCLEQLSSRAVGMEDPKTWSALMDRLPEYLTDSGLVSYFPGGPGSTTLTAQLLEVTARAQALGWPYALPTDARRQMVLALQNYIFGRLKVHEWAPANDQFWRKLVAVDALAFSGAWQPGMLDSLAIDVSDQPTPVVVTWLSILEHVPSIANREALIRKTDAVLRSRLSRHGTSLVISDPSATQGWWLMSNVTTAQARLLMVALSRPEWHDDLPRLLTGLLSLQNRGAWSTTTANVLGVLAVNQYAQQEEKHAGQGAVQVALAAVEPPQILKWADMPRTDGVHRRTLQLPWPKARTGVLTLAQEGAGSGWATVTARAAVPESEPVDAGLRVERRITPVSQARPGDWSVGDVYRVHLTIHTHEPLVWTVISDPVPAGASILGGGLGRDSAIATSGESGDDQGWNRPSFIERDAGVYRAYFEVMDVGTQTLEYTVRINAPGEFHLPPTRAQALYQPDVYASLPNQTFHVEAAP